MATTTTRIPEVRDPTTGAGYVRDGNRYSLVTSSVNVFTHLPLDQDMTPWVDRAGDARLLTEDELAKTWWSP